MAVSHTVANRLAIFQKLNDRLAALIAFNQAHSDDSIVWTDEDARQHWRLLERYGDAISELREFETSPAFVPEKPKSN
jgi:hypothetical protein